MHAQTLRDLVCCNTGHNRDTTVPQSWHVAWSGNASKGQHLEVPGALAGCLGIAQGITVSVRAVPDIPEAIGVYVEPISVDDWEVVEQNAGHMEDQILTQVYSVSLALISCFICPTSTADVHHQLVYSQLAIKHLKLSSQASMPHAQ